MSNFLFDKDTWQEIYESIRKNKTRTAITIFGVMWGVFLLVVLLGAARGMENSFNRMFGDFATNSVFVWGQSTSKPFSGYQTGKRVAVYSTDLPYIKNLPGVDMVLPRNRWTSQVVFRENIINEPIFGDYPELDLVQKKHMVKGRFINQSDMDNKKKVCVIEDQIYQQLFPVGEDPIGQLLKINDVNYKIVGLYKNKQEMGGPGGSIHIPFKTFQQMYSWGNEVTWFTITGKPTVDIKQLESDVKLLLKNLHGVHPEDDMAYGSFNMGERFEKMNGFLVGMKFLTWFVGIATLIAGVFAIGNILLITVKERTQEIGVRRALGAKPGEIRRQIILESIFLTTIAGTLGIISGGLILMLLDRMVGQGPDATLVNPSVDIPTILIAFTIMMVMGTLIGMIPAQIAISVKPIDALREE